ncbi:hypothetical protein F4803DRAFT_497936 [Xylaria telfairii]|nr:hypothetical protein F4803DRAFT_497936 [Xylaria telfairii]
MKTCEYCGHTFSPQRLSTHQKPKNNGGCAPCTLRFPCTLPSEPGCSKTFAHKRDRLRHRETVCKNARPGAALEPGFKCRCGKTIKRWYQFKSHQTKCRADKDSKALFVCGCRESFNTMVALEEHHETEKGRAGRPRKKQPATT